MLSRGWERRLCEADQGYHVEVYEAMMRDTEGMNCGMNGRQE